MLVVGWAAQDLETKKSGLISHLLNLPEASVGYLPTDCHRRFVDSKPRLRNVLVGHFAELVWTVTKKVE
jgi:hypothetical protein